VERAIGGARLLLAHGVGERFEQLERSPGIALARARDRGGDQFAESDAVVMSLRNDAPVRAPRAPPPACRCRGC
jgi:hypothetical protein